MSGGFKDHFSGHAAEYAAARPSYPEALFDWLAQEAPARHLAWDCATGSGQAAAALARRFERVYASDASAEQIRHAQPALNIEYRVERAEHCGLEHGSADLVSVAQACHWFDHAAFVAEVSRVCRPGGVLAVWTYALARVSTAVDAIVDTFYRDVLGPYWPPERRHVECGYRDLSFPWPELRAPAFAIRLDWTASRFEDYLRTWSAVRRYREDKQADPLAALQKPLCDVWGEDAAQPRTVEWPIKLRAFRMV